MYFSNKVLQKRLTITDEAVARAYISQMWAEAMTIYRSGKYKLSFSAEMNVYLKAHQQDFMQEDTQAGMIYAYLEDYTGDRVCSKQLYEEALETAIPRQNGKHGQFARS